MNKEHLKKCEGAHVRLRPVPRTVGGTLLDDDWLVTSVGDRQIHLAHATTGAPLSLGIDHVHRYSSRIENTGPSSSTLVLLVHVFRPPAGDYHVEDIVPNDPSGTLALAALDPFPILVRAGHPEWMCPPGGVVASEVLRSLASNGQTRRRKLLIRDITLTNRSLPLASLTVQAVVHTARDQTAVGVTQQMSEQGLPIVIEGFRRLAHPVRLERGETAFGDLLFEILWPYDDDVRVDDYTLFVTDQIGIPRRMIELPVPGIYPQPAEGDDGPDVQGLAI